MSYQVKAIGVIHSPFHEKAGMPIQASRSEAMGEVEVNPEYAAGLEGIEAFSHIFLIYRFHLSPDESQLIVKPFLDDHEHGVFATRYPVRPNNLGFSVVRLINRRENRLTVQGVDVLDGTPLLDIKPYFPEFDLFTDTKNGWYDKWAYR